MNTTPEDAATPLLLAVDPGPVDSAWVLINVDTLRPICYAKEPNQAVRGRIHDWPEATLAVEMVASYGMPVGAEIFETCVEIGRMVGAKEHSSTARLVYRRQVKLHHCGTSAAKDSNIIQALVDRFAHGQPNRGKGTKKLPGFFHGFSKDIWQAYALAVYAAERRIKQ